MPRGVFIAATDGGFTQAVALDLLILMAASAVVLLVFSRLRLAAVAGYLITGVLIGPSVVGLVAESDHIEAIAHMATVLLMFSIGLHMDLTELRTGLLRQAGAGVVSTLVMLALVAGVMMVSGYDAPAALAVGMALSMSSTAVVLRMLQQRRELHRMRGRASLAILLVQDLLAVVYLAVLPMLAALRDGPDSRSPLGNEDGWLAAASEGGIAIAAVGGLILFGKLLLPRLLAESVKHGGTELLLIGATAVGMGAAVLTGAVGLSPELGAFIAGFLLASTDFKHQISGQLAPVRDLLLAVFFISVGLQVDLQSVTPSLGIAIVTTVSLIAAKVVVIGLSSWCFGMTPRLSVATGLALGQGGEFSLMVLAAAAAGDLLSGATQAVVVAVIVVSILVTPMLLWVTPRAERRVSRWPTVPWGRRRPESHAPEGEHEDKPARTRAVVAGFGIIGRAVADKLAESDLPVTIVELNTKTVSTQRKLGRDIVFGDVSNPDVIEALHLPTVRAVVLTIPDDEAMLRAVRAIHEADPEVVIAARATFLSHAHEAMQAGAHHIVVEEFAAAEAMVQKVVQGFPGR